MEKLSKTLLWGVVAYWAILIILGIVIAVGNG